MFLPWKQTITLSLVQFSSQYFAEIVLENADEMIVATEMKINEQNVVLAIILTY